MKLLKYKTANETASALIERLLDLMSMDEKKKFHIAFSGGSTPALIFDMWANEYKDEIGRAHV